jgi:hypothetical protein
VTSNGNPCEWSSIDNGPTMPEPGIDEIRRTAYLIGITDVTPGDEISRLIREAYRHGWEAAQTSHDDWADR